MDTSLLRSRTPAAPSRSELLDLAIACKRRPHLHRLLLLDHSSSPFAQLASLSEDELLLVMRAATAVLAAAPRAARALLRPADLLPLLIHPTPRIRAAAAPLAALLVRLPDGPRALLASRWQAVVGPPGPSSGQLVDGTAPADAAAALGDELHCCLPGHVSSTSADSATSASGTASASGFVSIAHSEDVLRRLALALASTRPLLLCGPAGCGKSAMISELATRLGQRDRLVRVHMDEQIDSKVLLGTYVCAEGSGEFAWQPGVVSQAVSDGRWLVLEDIDRAPLEVMASLAPLLEGGSLYVPGRARALAPPPSFRLLATVTVHGGRAAAAAVTRAVYRPACWQRILVPPPSARDLAQIINVRYPLVSKTSRAMVRTLLALMRNSAAEAEHEAANAVTTVAAAAEDPESPSAMEVEAAATSILGDGDDEAEEAAAAHHRPTGSGRALSGRDLLRWSSRVSAMLTSKGIGALPPSISPRLTEHLRELLLVEALDVFVASLRTEKARDALAARLATLWNVPPERAHYMLHLYKPPLQVTPAALRIGRIAIPISDAAGNGGGGNGGAFAQTRQTLALMERVGACVRMGEPVLLVGETGTGKTTAVQHLAMRTGRRLLVHNLSEQSDSSELIGGYRPVQMRHILTPLASRFESAFCRTFSRARNASLLDKLAQRLAKGDWKKVLLLMLGTLKTVQTRAVQAAGANAVESPSKRQKTGSEVPPDELPADLANEWRLLSADIARVQRQVDNPSDEGVAFSFVEGSLVRALREGHWLLLDEMNLASAETLERVAAVLEEGGSLALTERGEADALVRHPDFRVFGAMNPPTDFGKKELPPGIRARFTELYVPPITTDEDLQLVVLGILQPVLPHSPVSQIVAFYRAAMAEADSTLLDGANQRPQYSLRTLCRALSYVAGALLVYGLDRALWDGFHMTFVTQLQQQHQAAVEALLLTHLLPRKGSKRTAASAPPKPPPMSAPPRPSDGEAWVQFGGFWVPVDPRGTPAEDSKYIVTPTIESRLQMVARMIAARRYPVLLQGPTSAGKTSMVERLARATGHRLVRINNHEHTDVQEYIGSFQPGSTGRLEFCDGALTQAVRHGYWIVLDELNLAPSEVLEALNRLLDDNRELLLPETGETVRPHPHFMLFATQNPPGSYGGRKVLSRAFRNRFVQLQMDEIPTAELAQILEKRCAPRLRSHNSNPAVAVARGLDDDSLNALAG